VSETQRGVIGAGHGEWLAADERRRAFIARLDRMSPEERLRAARHEFDREQRSVWAGRYPEEVPTVDGEVEWIALRLP
jgi:hypothetical protein